MAVAAIANTGLSGDGDRRKLFENVIRLSYMQDVLCSDVEK